MADISKPDEWRLYDSNGLVLLDDAEDLTDFVCRRPPSDDRDDHPFWPVLLRVLDEIGGVLFWPGDGSVVADAAVIEHMSAEMLEGIGVPTVCKTAAEVTECIQKG